jgi:diadenosine tetraphosphatase ApaH/serine/threonine PP2A family protein phosphatase
MGKALGAAAGDVVCFGHTHRAFHRVVDGVHFVNTGSVGRPKDGDPRAGYVLLDVERGRVEVQFVRVRYDIDAAVAAIHESTLPNEFADQLRAGGTAVRA